jgi:hypothetical protein
VRVIRHSSIKMYRMKKKQVVYIIYWFAFYKAYNTTFAFFLLALGSFAVILVQQVFFTSRSKKCGR